MSIEVVSAKKKDADTVANLMQLYLYDFSEFSGEAIGANGRFDYKYLDLYWEDPDRYPFLVRTDGHLSGFALVRFEADPVNATGVMEMAEFFVMRSFRRKGVGSDAARRLWNLFPGQWRLNIWRANVPAYNFWKPLIADYTNNKFEEKGKGTRLLGETVFSFKTGEPIDPPGEFEPVDF